MKKRVWLFFLFLLLTACTTTIIEETEDISIEETTDTSPKAIENLTDTEYIVPITKENLPQEEEYEQASTEDIPSCGEEQEIFSLAPLDPENIKDITPLGNLAPSAHTFPTIHMYWNLKNSDEQDENSVALSAPIYAPSDMYITQMSRIEDVGDDGGLPDYSIRFYPCQEVYAYFDHLATVSGDIETAFEEASEDFCEEYTLYYESGPRTWSYCRKELSMFMKKGDYIGTVGGGQDQKSLDIGIYDYRITPHSLANPARWELYADGNLPYVACPLDYFPKEIREAYETLIPRKAEPVCGEVVQDIAGTAQGNWLPKGTSIHIGAENEFLALVHDNYDPSQPVFSIGTGVETILYGEYIFSVKEQGLINRDFSDITADKVYCYEGLEPSGSGNSFEGIIIVQISEQNTLKIEGQEKTSCASSWEFSGKETSFER